MPLRDLDCDLFLIEKRLGNNFLSNKDKEFRDQGLSSVEYITIIWYIRKEGTLISKIY
jgi:hypothetical protein